MFRRNKMRGNYAYTVARVKAKKSLLLGDEDYNKMLQMSAPEISRYISEAGYHKEMVELAGRFNGVSLIEHATYSNMSYVFNSIIKASQGELKLMVVAYLKKWDAWNLKVILRGKSYGLDIEKIKEYLVPAGSISTRDLDKIVTLNSRDDILIAYSKLAGIPQQEILKACKDTQTLSNVEDFLDEYYYYSLLSSLNPSSRPAYMFRSYIREEIDIKNLETILKLKTEGIYGEPVIKYMIPGGKDIDKKLAIQLANAETISEVANSTSQLEFSGFINSLVDNKNLLLRDVVHEMDKYKIAQAKKFSHMYPLSVIPIIDYMIHKENEVSNIRMIARGLENGLNKDTIKGLLVI